MRPYRWLPIIITFGIFLLCTSAAYPTPVHADGTLFRLVAPSTPQSTSDPVQVWLEIEDAVGLAGWEFDLDYDHSLATLTTITLSEFVGETGTCDPTSARCVLPLAPKEILNATAVGSYSYGTGTGGNGNGVVATFTFQPTGKTGQTLLHITHPLLADNSGVPLIPSTQDALLQFGVPTGVTLATFTVEPRPTDLLVQWETASEINTLGFNLYRSTNPDVLGTRLNSELIPSQSPGGGQGAMYEWVDGNVTPNILYYYWLEDIDLQGNSNVHGPVGGALGSPTAIEGTDLQIQGGTYPSPLQLMAGLMLLGLNALLVRWGWLHSVRWTRTFLLFFIALSLLIGMSLSLTNAAPLSPPLSALETDSSARIAPTATCFPHDLTCDHAIDETDLSLESQRWHCALNEACYEPRFDFDGNGQVTVVDLQLLAREYDRTAPLLNITTPADSAVLVPPSVTVSGIVTDRHEVVNLTINGVAATLTGNDFSATVPLQGGNQTIIVMAEDELGATSTKTVVVKGDNSGPLLSILSPADRQSLYTDQPYIDIQYKDFLSSIDLNSLQVTLTPEGGSSTDITADLTIETNQAFGVVADVLTTDSVYTLTVSLADTVGNISQVQNTFYIPSNPYSIPQPTMEEGGGWYTGVVYDSATCDEFLKGCQPLTGVTITAARLDPDNRNTNGLYGTVISGPDGFFAFPFTATGTYALRFEKQGFTYSQREINVARGHSTAANAIYLTPFDTAITPCDSSGCTHNSADGQMRVIIPAGAIPDGQALDVTATLFDRVNFLPGGELPPGTQETYAFNLSGESDFEFTKPVTIQVRNYRDFDPGTLIPLGVWNPETLQWDHAGTGEVDPTGEWVMIEVIHFSMYDCNDPMVPSDPGASLDDETEEEDKCIIGSPGCLIHAKSGIVQEWIDDIPTVNVLGREVGPVLRYSTARANPSAVIDIRLNINPDPEMIESFDPYLFYELYIEGVKTDEFTLALDYTQPGEVGRYRYLWDGRNALGEQLPPGVYEYGVKVTFSFIGEYCYASGGIFGNPPDCVFGRTGRFQRATASEWLTGTVELNGQGDSPYGAGWILEGQQELFRDESGHVLVADSEELAEYYTELGDELRGRGYYNVPQPPVFAPASVLPLTPAPAGGTFVNGQLTTDTTWTLAGSPYKIVGNDVMVPDNITLTIEPGVEVLVEKGRALNVEGTLQAVGTATQPITMTIYSETMVDSFESVSTHLNGTTALSVDSTGDLWYAGTESSYSSGIALWHIASNGSQTDLPVPPELHFGSLVYDLAHDANDNIYLATNEGAAFYDSTADLWAVYRDDTSPIPSNYVQAVTVTTDSVWFATTSGVAHLQPSTQTWTLYTFEDGLASSNVLAIAIAPDGSLWFGTDAGLTIRSTTGTWLTYNTTNSPILGNIVNEIAFDEEGDAWLAIEDHGISILSATATWSDYTPTNSGLHSRDISALVVAGTTYKWFGHPFEGVSYLKNNNTLWYFQESPALPGNEVRDITVTPDGTVWLAHYNEAFLTQVRRVPVTTPTISGGFWDFVLGCGNDADNNSSHLNYVTIEGSGLNQPGGLYLYRSAPTLENVTIRASGGNGLHGLEVPPLTLNNLTIEANDEDGIHLEDDVIIGTLTNFSGDPHHFSNIVVQDNNGHALYLDDGTDVELTDSTLARNKEYGIYTAENGGEVTLLNSTIQANGVAARVAPESDLSGVVWDANKRNDLEWTSGVLSSAHTWGPVLGGITTFRVVGNVLVSEGASLTVSAGTAVLFESNGGLTVLGVLTAVGDENNVVYFGPADDNDWSAIQVGGGVSADSNASQLRYVVVEKGQLNIYQTTPALLDHITVRDAYSTGLAVYDSPGLLMSDCNLVGNGFYGLYNDTPDSPVTALNCYWGDPTGPFHPFNNPDGLGQPLSDGVNFTPWNPKAILMERFRPVVRNNTSPDQSLMRYDFEDDTYTRYYPDGREVQFDSAGHHLYTLEPDGRKTTYQYNPDGTLATMAMIAPGHTDPHWIWAFAYNDGKLASITDPAGRMTTFTVDTNGHLTEVELPDSGTRRFFYDERALLTQQADRTGDITTYVYDEVGRLTSHISPPRPITDPITGASEVRQEVRTYAPSDISGLLNESMVGDPDNPAPTPPLSEALVDTVTLERGEQSGHTNAFGSWLDNTDGVGRTTYYDYDGENNLTRLVQPDGDCVEFTYDSHGNVLTEQQMGATQCQSPPNDRDPSQIQKWIFTYEGRFDHVKTESDPLGRITTYIYDYELGLGEAGKLVRVELPQVDDGTGTIFTPTIAYTYNSLGLLESETNPRGTVTKYLYTQGIPEEAAGGATPYFRSGVMPIPGLLVQQIEDFGDAPHANLTTTLQDLDGAGNPGTVIGPAGHQTTTFQYDMANRVISETDAVGIETTYTYDDHGNLTTQVEDYTTDGTTGRNIVTHYTYDAENRLLTEQTVDNTLTVQTTSTYDENGLLASRSDGLGSTSFYAYDAADQLILEGDAAGESQSHTYAPDGQKQTTTDADGYTHHWTYDGLGRMVQLIQDEGGLNLTTLYSHDLANNQLSMTDAAGTVTCYGYDSHNRRVTETSDCGGLNLMRQYTYDVGDKLLREVNWRGVVTRYSYDSLGRLTLTRRDDGGKNLEESRVYEAAGNVAYSTDERGTVTTYGYDLLNRLTERCMDSEGLNLCTALTYDRLGNQATLTDPSGRVTHTLYNAFHLPIQVTQDEEDIGALTRYAYDNALNRTLITDANNNITAYTYTTRNEVASETYADGTHVQFTYNGRGNLESRTHQDGTTLTHTHDGAGRLLTRTFSTGGSQTFTYDGVNRMTGAAQTMDGHTSLVSFQFNPLGDLLHNTQTLDGLASTIEYDYDYLNDRYTVHYPSGGARVYALDTIGRLSSVATESTIPVANYQYHESNGFWEVTYNNGITTHVAYDPLYRTTQISSSVAEYNYGYDTASNVNYVQRAHHPTTPADVYEYDGMDRVRRVWYGADALNPMDITTQTLLQSYQLDEVGNRLEVRNNAALDTYGPTDGVHLNNPMHRYEIVDGLTLTYDAKGNLVEDGATLYTYDILNRQSSAEMASTTATYLYNALGWRIAKIVGDGSATATTHYLYDKRYRVLEEQRGDGSLQARYTYADESDEPLNLERGGMTYYYHRDALGNVTEMSDSTGIVVERYEYDIYGQPTIYNASDTIIPVSALGNPYLFTGRRWDEETGNYEYRNRMYAPRLGRFMQMDPLGFVDGMNQYSYVNANPTTFVDPMGLKGKKATAAPRDVVEPILIITNGPEVFNSSEVPAGSSAVTMSSYRIQYNSLRYPNATVKGQACCLASRPLPFIFMLIQIHYKPGVNPEGRSAYGRGTTDADVKNGNTSLRFHENQHVADHTNYINSHPLPVVVLPPIKALGMYDCAAMQTALDNWKEEFRKYREAMDESVFLSGDCVGIPSYECYTRWFGG